MKHFSPPSSRAVLLLNFGGPRNLDEVPEFLFEILRDPHVIKLPFPLPLQDKLARKISGKRSHEVREQYHALGGKSPIVEATERQRQAIEHFLSEAQSPMRVFATHRYLPGNAQAVAAQIVAENIEALYLIPLYPHYSWSTSGTSFEQIHEALKQQGYSGTLEILRSYPNQAGYLEALSEKLRETLQATRVNPQETLILCSAHGLPKAYVENGDPYLLELHLTLEELRQRFPEWCFQLSFQSRVGPAEWLKPYTDQLIPLLPKRGVRSLVFVGISFVNDHLETLYEVDRTYFELARSVGLQPYRVPAVEDHPQFIRLLAEAALAWSQGTRGLPLKLGLPPSQQFRRYDQWLLYGWLVALGIALFFAIG